MKKILTAAALSCLAAAGGLSGAGTAAADAGGLNLPSVVPLSGVLTPTAESADTPDLPPANAAVERLLPGH
ncbi:hypothetical protein ACFWV1_07250 [Streptomyces sp. NPDC058700]|uniref:hypothetical protein n=1 Tax=Streptomyces sp. NPDC058700 TaxID=3346607 RepID=UPI003666EAC0